MELIGISSFLNVKRCYLCHGEVEYFCHACQQDLCLHCKEEHVIDPDTKHHEVTIYRIKYKYIPTKKCVVLSDQIYEMYCKTCDIPVCLHSEKHRIHELCKLRTAYKDKQSQCNNYIMNIRSETLFNIVDLLEKLKTDFKTQQQIINCIKLNMFRKAQYMKYLLERRMMSYLYSYIYRISKQKKEMEQYIRRIETFERRIVEAVNTPVTFLRRSKMSPYMKYTIPYIKLVCSLEKICEEDVVAIFGEMQIKKRTKNESLLQQAASPVLQKTLTVQGVRRCFHISCYLRDRIWINDWNGLILTDTTTGKSLITGLDARHIGGTGIHSVNSKRELVYIDKQFNINKYSLTKKNERNNHRMRKFILGSSVSVLFMLQWTPTSRNKKP